MMNKNMIQLSRVVLMGVVLMSVSGCSNQHYAATHPNVYTVETASSKNIEILWADTYQIGDKVIVEGTLRRTQHNSIPMKAHVDIQVLSEDEQVAQKIRTPDISVPRNLPGKGINFERFKVELDHIPSEQTKIVLTAHQGPHDDNV